jgi:hypothetical protein
VHTRPVRGGLLWCDSAIQPPDQEHHADIAQRVGIASRHRFADDRRSGAMFRYESSSTRMFADGLVPQATTSHPGSRIGIGFSNTA